MVAWVAHHAAYGDMRGVGWQLEDVHEKRPAGSRIPFRYDDLGIERRSLQLPHEAHQRLRHSLRIGVGISVVAAPGDEADIGMTLRL